LSIGIGSPGKRRRAPAAAACERHRRLLRRAIAFGVKLTPRRPEGTADSCKIPKQQRNLLRSLYRIG
jgi:hypothetical protein